MLRPTNKPLEKPVKPVGKQLGTSNNPQPQAKRQLVNFSHFAEAGAKEIPPAKEQPKGFFARWRLKRKALKEAKAKALLEEVEAVRARAAAQKASVEKAQKIEQFVLEQGAKEKLFVNVCQTIGLDPKATFTRLYKQLALQGRLPETPAEFSVEFVLNVPENAREKITEEQIRASFLGRVFARALKNAKGNVDAVLTQQKKA